MAAAGAGARRLSGRKRGSKPVGAERTIGDRTGNQSLDILQPECVYAQGMPWLLIVFRKLMLSQVTERPK